MNRIIILFFIFFIFSFSAAVGENSNVALEGGGALNCKVYLNQIDNKGFSSSMFYWAQGYMSGINSSLLDITGKTHSTVNLATMNSEEKELFLRIWCRKNQDKSFYQAVEQLFDELSKLDKGK